MIIHIVTGINTKAPVKMALSLCTESNVNGKKSIILYLSKSKSDEKLIGEIRNNNITVDKFRLKYLLLDAVFHSHGIKPDILSFFIKILFRKKTIATLHCNPWREFEDRLAGKIIPKVWLSIVRRLDRLVLLTDYIKREIGNPPNSTIIHNGIDIQTNDLKDSAIVNVIREFKGNRKLLFSYGVLRELKGFDFLIEAMRFLDDSYCLVIAGDGIDRNRLNKIIVDMKMENRILLLGYIQNPYEYLDVDDILVFPSRSEGFPISIIEAMNIGKKPLVSDIGPFIEISNYAELTLFKLDCFESFIDAVTKLQSPNSYTNKEIAVRNFSSSVCYKRYEEIYDVLRGM
ncbi:glycosyltransferase family 4 protein [Vibrio cholerae]